MDLKLRILGSSSAIPTVGRHPTAQFLSMANRHFLIDCGEGTQVQLRKYKIGFGRINHIMISHLHGDHFYGLVPLLTSLHLLDREKELHLYGPAGLEEGVSALLKISGSRLRFPLVYHVLNTLETEIIYEDEALWVYSFPLRHSMPCCGFFFREKPRPRNMRKEMLAKYQIPVAEIRKIKRGADWVNEEGVVIPNHLLTYKPDDALSYAFCTDTSPLRSLADMLPVAPELMYHEATFTQEHKQRAKKTFHSTAAQAGEIAQHCQARHLLIGHFSVRYEDLGPLLQEARSIFPATHLAMEGCQFSMHTPGELKAEKPLAQRHLQTF